MTTTAATPTTPAVTPGWWAHRFGGMSRTFWILFTGTGLSRLGFFVIPFMTFWLVNDRNLNAGQAAVVMTCFGAGWTLGMPAGGWLADRTGRKGAIIAAGLLSAGAYLLLGAAPTLPWLCAAAVAAGATFDAGRPAVQALMTDTVTPTRQATALGLLYWVMNASRFVSCLIGGLMASHDFRILFIVNATLNVAFAAAVARTVTEPARPRRNDGPVLRTVFADRRMAVFTLVTLVFFTVHTQSVVTLPIIMNQAGVTPIWYGIILAADPLAVAVAQLLLQGQLTSRPAYVVCAAGIATVGVGLAVTGVGQSTAWFLSTTPLWVCGEVAVLAVAPGIVANLAPAHLRGAYFGVWGATLGASALLAPGIAALLINLGGAGLLWACCIAAALCAAAACLRLNHQPEPAMLAAAGNQQKGRLL
ncbi:MFS transporter [Catellatospora paridis]|uniref:MFS transporter n=1 Tax=Catellatospora paridis TaxID=1617086 RepID=UPI0012D3DD5C|nr:MFS transporter [Catellatospora paridis]